MALASHSFRALVATAALLGSGMPRAYAAFPILNGDPINPNDNRPYTIFPGLPLLLEPDDDAEPPVVDTTKLGDVDLVVREGTPFVGASIPPPASAVTTAIAGGTHVTDGTSVAFRVIASGGALLSALGTPLPGAELDGLPAIVFVFADLDGDGFVGPTNADPAGANDNGRELQESLFPVGREFALFTNGVASGAVAVALGAPASAGGLRVILTAAAYIGDYGQNPFPNIPAGPAVATLMPIFPRLDPDRVVEGDGNGGRLGTAIRIDLELSPAFAHPVGDPFLGTPFAVPTDGSSLTIDRASVVGGAVARGRFVRASSPDEFAAGLVTETPAPLFRGGGGILLAPLTTIDVLDDGPGQAALARLVPVDRLDNVTDPGDAATVELRAGPGVTIEIPNTDGDLTRESVPLTAAGGLDIGIGDTGGPNDSGSTGTVAVLVNGYVVEELAVQFLPAGATTTTTATFPSTTSLGVTTTTTAVGATSTTTFTLPLACNPTPSFSSVACQVSQLQELVSATVPTGSLRDSLLRLSDRPRLLIIRAEEATRAGKRGPARTALQRALPPLKALRRRLASRAAQRTIPDPTRGQLLDATGRLAGDLKALRGGLRGTPPATTLRQSPRTRFARS